MFQALMPVLISAGSFNMRMNLENIIKKAGKFIAKKAILPLSFVLMTQSASALFEKNPIIMPLGSAISYSVQASQGTKYSGDSIEATMTPDDKPYQNVKGQYQFVAKGDSLTGTWTDQNITESNGSYKMQLDSTQPGDYYFKFKMNSGSRETETDSVKVPVYMNEIQSDQALAEAIDEIGVKNVNTALENEITDKWENQSSLGYTSDAVIAVKNTSKRSSANPRALYYVDVKGSNSDVETPGKKTNLNANGEGCIYIQPVQSKDELKQILQQEKSSAWPQIGSISSGYTISTSSGYIFSGDNTSFSIASNANGAEIAVKKPTDSNYSAYEALTKSGSSFTKTQVTSGPGDYNAKFRLSLDRTVMNEVIESSQVATSKVYMNEAESDAALNSIITPMVKAGSTTNYDITNADFNFSEVFGAPPHLYTDDVEVTVYDSNVVGNQRATIIDVQGSASDTYNSQKKTDADASNIVYKYISPVSSQTDLENKVNEIKNNHWQ